MLEVSNVKIVDAEIEIIDYGIITFYLSLEGDGFGVNVGGFTVGVGGYVGFNDNIIRAILNTVGVSKWSQLKGKYCRIKSEGWGSNVKDIGNIVEDKWINLEELYDAEKKNILKRGEDDEEEKD